MKEITPFFSKLSAGAFVALSCVFLARESWQASDHEWISLDQVVEGMDVVKKIESFGSQTGKTSKMIMVADCGQC